MKFAIYQASRQGGRRYNQDRVAYSYSREALFMVVADGMGGHFHGEVAAQIAVQLSCELFRRDAQPIISAPHAFLEDALLHVHDAIYQYTLEHGLEDFPRTTCVACIVQRDAAWWAHVGDSRLYLFRKGRLLARTRDHSRVQQLYESGRLTEAQMRVHPERNKIYNCLGGEVPPEIELAPPTPLHGGDALLLCSDGLWSMLSANEMGSILDAFPVDRAVNELLDHAELRAGQASDNLSAVGLVWGEPAGKGAVAAATLPQGVITTQLDTFRPSGPKASDQDISEEDIERAIREIQAAIRKHAR